MRTSAAGISWRDGCERATAGATAVLLQTALYLALSHWHPSLSVAVKEPSLIAMVLTATRTKPEAPPPVSASERLVPVPLPEQPMPRPIAPPGPQTHASASAIDWQAAIQHEVGTQQSRSRAAPKRRFDFPLMPATQGPVPTFEWDDKNTNHIQRLAHGIIDLGSHCFILLWPPIPQCHSEPADGSLFQHMHDPSRNDGPSTLP